MFGYVILIAEYPILTQCSSETTVETNILKNPHDRHQHPTRSGTFRLMSLHFTTYRTASAMSWKLRHSRHYLT